MITIGPINFHLKTFQIVLLDITKKNTSLLKKYISFAQAIFINIIHTDTRNSRSCAGVEDPH